MFSEAVCTGIVLKSTSYGEYDRRLVLLTLERGKIVAFARGARRAGSPLMGASMGFAMGSFTLVEGRDAYSLKRAVIKEHFEQLVTDLDKFACASYFVEIADYYTRENNDDAAQFRLLVRTLKLLCRENADAALLRCIYEIRSIAVNGDFPGMPEDMELLDGTRHALRHIVNAREEELFSFRLREDVQEELKKVCGRYMESVVDRKFKSLEFM